MFTLDPYDQRLKTHKLSGKLKDLWSFTVDYDERVLFYFTEDEKAVFVDIGSHDEVYWGSKSQQWGFVIASWISRQNFAKNPAFSNS